MARTLSKSNVSCCGIHCRSSPGCICNKVSVSKSNREGDGGVGGRCNYVDACAASVAGTRRAMHRPMKMIYRKDGAEAIAFKCSSQSLKIILALHGNCKLRSSFAAGTPKRIALMSTHDEELQGAVRGGRLVCRTNNQYHTSTGLLSRD